MSFELFIGTVLKMSAVQKIWMEGTGDDLRKELDSSKLLKFQTFSKPCLYPSPLVRLLETSTSGKSKMPRKFSSQETRWLQLSHGNKLIKD